LQVLFTGHLKTWEVWWDNFKTFKIIFSCLISSIAAMFFITFLEFFFCKVNFIYSLCLSIFLAGFNYFSNHMVRFQYDAAIYPLDHALIFRDGTRGLGGFHLKLGPRIISRVFRSKMTETAWLWKWSAREILTRKKIRDGFLKMRNRFFTFVLFKMFLPSWSFSCGQNKKKRHYEMLKNWLQPWIIFEGTLFNWKFH